MREFVVILGATLIMAVLAAGILGQGMRVAGVDPRYVRSVPDRVRYNSMGTIVLLTAMAATASLTVALSLVFPTTPWPQFLPVGILWGSIVLNFDRWIVSSIDYGPLTAADME